LVTTTAHLEELGFRVIAIQCVCDIPSLFHQLLVLDRYDLSFLFADEVLILGVGGIEIMQMHEKSLAGFKASFRDDFCKGAVAFLALGVLVG
jgi:hypothetical protein